MKLDNRPKIHPDSIFLDPLRSGLADREFSYEAAIKAFEIRCEADFAKTLVSMGIITSVQRYTLQFSDEVVVVRRFSEYINDPYYFAEVNRQFVKAILAKDIPKFRYYFFINVFDNRRIATSYIKYTFRYLPEEMTEEELIAFD